MSKNRQKDREKKSSSFHSTFFTFSLTKLLINVHLVYEENHFEIFLQMFKLVEQLVGICLFAKNLVEISYSRTGLSNSFTWLHCQHCCPFSSCYQGHSEGKLKTDIST
ncbi:hypothetical protein GOODEAATRI_004799 [Goodea atripinnis]|uniref:Uncharacterized protein n=2 Tax=Goodeidae TaxID=28758 RepID=A0ABU7B069_9TELE|nr:hypothetical protein [Ataeniobius toweri]